MKPALIGSFILAVVLFSGVMLHAQPRVSTKVLSGVTPADEGVKEDVPYLNAVSINPLGLIHSFAYIQYEQKLSHKNSFTARLNFLSREIDGDQNSALGAGGSYRWYLYPGYATDGLFAGPAVDLLFWQWEKGKENISATFVNVGGELGFKWSNNQYFIEPVFVLQFSFGKAETENGIANSYGDGFEPALRMNFGLKW